MALQMKGSINNPSELFLSFSRFDKHGYIELLYLLVFKVLSQSFHCDAHCEDRIIRAER